MGPKQKSEVPEMNPEEIVRKKFQRRCRFRAIVRLVIANLYWLREEIENYEGDDVKMRVEQAVRSKAKNKQMLSLSDKVLLNKSADVRTNHEKKYIYRIIGNLKFFRRTSSHVKKGLAAVTYFRYYGPNRVIVRQGQEGHAAYFLVSGKVSVTRLLYDGLLNQNVPENIGHLQEGDVFGEVSLLNDIPRTATVTTTDHCEMLIVLREDFKVVLQTTVQEKWDEVLAAMSSFPYFDSIDQVSRREGCIVARLQTFEPNEIILGDGNGLNFVYFLLQGRCQMIEALQIVTIQNYNKKYYKLHDPYVQTISEPDLAKKYFVNETSECQIPTSNFKAMSHDDIKSSASISSKSGVAQINSKHRGGGSIASVFTTDIYPIKENYNYYNRHDYSNENENMDIPSTGNKTVMISRRIQSIGGAQNNIIHYDKSAKSLIESCDSFRMNTPTKKFENIKTHMMQVCQFNPGSTFGFGENMRDRGIVSLTSVKVMILPKTWLLQKNHANIWTRIEHYLQRTIPTKHQLFKKFVSQRRWEEYKQNVVKEVVARKKSYHTTSVHDVPYSIRIEEMTEEFDGDYGVSH